MSRAASKKNPFETTEPLAPEGTPARTAQIMAGVEKLWAHLRAPYPRLLLGEQERFNFGPEFEPELERRPAPCQQHSETSREAAEQIEPARDSLRGKVLAFIRKRGDRGATDDEIQIALRMNPSTQRPRRIELWHYGLIQPATDGRRKEKIEITRPTRSGRPAKVWIVAQTQNGDERHEPPAAVLERKNW